MYGEKKTQATINCHICGKPKVLFVDKEDVERAIADRTKELRDFCVDRAGRVYLTPAECELLISGTCEACWKVLCPEDDKSYN